MPKKKTKKKINSKTHIIKRAPKELFVTNFIMVMQRFPEYYGADLSVTDEEIVYDFFTRVVRFTEKGVGDFDPAHPLMAFVLVNYPDEILRCKCNPFRQSLLYRAVNLVGAVFQVVIDCRFDEDDSMDDFLPLFTAKNFMYSLFRFKDTLDMFSVYFNSGQCQCEAKG